MPIYEFYCEACHRIYSFLSRAVTTSAVPACPRCGAAGLRRKASVFAISKGRKEDEGAADGMPDLDDERLERAMAALEGDLDSVDENDPRQAARMMRRLFEATGLPVGSGMEEALRRMEGGEDPDRIDEELGDVLEEDPFAAPAPGAGRLRALRRRYLPPTVDPKLYEM